MKIILLIAVVLVVSCQDEASLIGENFFKEEAFSSSFVDTISLKVSTVVYDSLPSNNSGRLLVGRYVDPFAGVIESMSLLEPGLGEDSYFLDPATTSYDSILLVLFHDGYSYFVTEEERQTVEVRRLNRQMELREDDLLYTSSVEVHDEILNSTAIGQQTFKSDLEEGDQIEIPLDDGLGLEIYKRSTEEDDDLFTSEEFKEYFKGLIIQANEDGKGFSGFSDSSELRLYYSDHTTLPITSQYLSFPISGNLYYNSILHNSSESQFVLLKTLDEPVPTEDTDNEGAIIGGVGFGVRIEMPYLRNLLFENEEFLISSAVLKIPVSDDSYGESTPLPDVLQVLYVGDNNEELATLNTGSLTLDAVYSRDTYYEVDVLSFINSQLSIQEFNENALLLRLPDDQINRSVSRAIISDQANGMELKIYTISTNN